MEKLKPKLGIDLGGTKIEGLLTDKSGEQLKRIRVKTPGGNYADILNAIAHAWVKRRHHECTSDG